MGSARPDWLGALRQSTTLVHHFAVAVVVLDVVLEGGNIPAQLLQLHGKCIRWSAGLLGLAGIEDRRRAGRYIGHGRIEGEGRGVVRAGRGKTFARRSRYWWLVVGTQSHRVVVARVEEVVERGRASSRVDFGFRASKASSRGGGCNVTCMFERL